MFKLNDKKHRKRALMKLQQCKPNCGANGEKDDFYEASHQHKTINKTTEVEIKYNLDDAPNHLVRKTMKFEEIRSQTNGNGADEVDHAGSSHSNRQLLLEFPSLERNIQSKVVRLMTLAPRNVKIRSRTCMIFKCTVNPHPK